MNSKEDILGCTFQVMHLLIDIYRSIHFDANHAFFACMNPKLPKYVQLEPTVVDGEEVKDEAINVGCAVKFSTQVRMQL